MAKSASSQRSVRQFSFGRSRAYLFEYGLMLFSCLVLINVLVMMLQEILGKQASFLQNILFLPYLAYPSFAGTITTEILATFLVVFPLTIILIQRTVAAEKVNPDIKNLGWRKGLLSAFLIVAAVWAAVSLISVLAAGLRYLNVGSLTEVAFDWREAVENLSRALLLAVAIWAFASDYRHELGRKVSVAMHVFRYGIVLVGLVIGLLFIFIPFMGDRQKAVDAMIVNDLYNIRSQIDNSYYSGGDLPSDLDSLKLSDEEKNRMTRYAYTYENNGDGKYTLCAVFYKESSSAEEYMLAGNYYPLDGDFSIHGQGKDCFEINLMDYTMPEPMPAEIVEPSGFDMDLMEQDLTNEDQQL